jgi:hypothetical protein
MKRIRWILLITLYGFSQPSFSQIASEWKGEFIGSMLGINATMVGTLSGAQWTGTIDASGYPIQLQGTVIDMQCNGTMSDQKTQETIPFTAKYAGNQITISIRDINPLTDQMENMEFVFTRTSGSVSPEYSGLSHVTVVDGVDASKLDRALIGLWRYTDTYVSGEYSFATDYFIQFNANGAVYLTDGRTAGGGMTSSLDTGAGDIHEGIWKTENKTLWTSDGKGEWHPYAKYYVDGRSMMLTYNNGKKQVWERL